MTFDQMCDALAAYYPEVHYLFYAGQNFGAFEFKKYSLSYYVYSNISLSTDDHMIFSTTSNNGAGAGSAIFSTFIDLTNYSKIVIKHNTTLPEASTYTNSALFVTNALTTPISAAKQTYLCRSSAASGGIVTLDISSLSGNYSVGVNISLNVVNSTGTIDIEYIYLE